MASKETTLQDGQQHIISPGQGLLACVLALAGFGLVMVLSASYFWSLRRSGIPNGTYLFHRQTLFVLGSLIILLITSQIPLSLLKRSVTPLYAISVILLGLVLVPSFGTAYHGAQRWIELGPIGFQPSEPAKVSMIMMVAYFVASNPERIQSFFKGYLPVCGLIALPAGLILIEPNLGTGVFIIGLGLFVAIAGGLRLLHLVPSVLLAIPPMAFMMWNRFAHFRERILVFLNPGSDPLGTGHQIRQSLIAIGSGTKYGQGLGLSRQKLFFLPQQNTDFIFSVIGEETGFVGCLLVILLYMGIVWFGFRIAMNARDRFAKLVAAGFTLCISLQALLNIAIATAMFPTKGLPLPLISYGGSSLVITLFMVGILLSIHSHTRSCGDE